MKELEDSRSKLQFITAIFSHFPAPWLWSTFRNFLQLA